MKYTSQQCFRDAYACGLWQVDNCLQCKKGVCYNTKLKRMPQYRCAIQQQIEEQQVGGELAVTQRTFDAVQGKVCQFFVPKVEIVEQPKVLDFSKGESIYQEPPKEEPKEQEAPQPTIEELKPATHEEALKQMSIDTKISIDDLRAAEKRMFDKIAKNGHLPPLPLPPMPYREMLFRQEVKNDVQVMLETFTWNENMMIAFVPLVISRIAWHYADKVTKYCGENRLQDVRKLSNTVKIARERYLDDLRKDLDFAHIHRVEAQAMQFMQLHRYEFQVLWLQAKQAILKEHPNLTHKDMRTDVLCGITMIKLLKQHNENMDKVIAKKMGKSKSITNFYKLSLEKLLNAYLPTGFKIEDTSQIDLCIRVLMNKMREIDFVVVDDTANKAG